MIQNIYTIGIFLLLFTINTSAQVICVFCYDQNDSISQPVNNLLINGGFENHTCVPDNPNESCCPNSNLYSGDILNWTCTGGGVNTYTNIVSSNFSTIPEGTYAVYFGNAMCNACSFHQFDTTCLFQNSCIVGGVPPGFPSNAFTGFGGSTGVSLEQTVTGLIPGQAYVLEFWAGGEGDSTSFFFLDNGIFAVDVGFGNIFLSCKPTLPFPIHIGTRFIIEFYAATSSHTIKFTNWGHMCENCTELILDDVRLYTLAELSPSVPSCSNLPTADFYSIYNLCPGTCTEFANISFNATSYQWNFPGANPDTSTANNPTDICYATPGSYDVQLIASNSNGSDTLLLSNYITVYPTPPSQGILQSGDTLFANAGAASYRWLFNGNFIPGATNYFYVAPQSGDYNVIATDQNGCESEAVINNVIASIASAEKCGSITIFPNPVKDRLIMHDAECMMRSAKDISIYNMLGEKVMTVTPLSFGEEQEGEADVSELRAGIYYLELVFNKKIYRTKFLKH